MVRKKTALVFVVGISVALMAYRSGSPGQRTGSSFDGQTCGTSNCHGSQVPTPSDLLMTDIPTSGFKADSTYTITVLASKPAINTYGFELMVEDDGGQPIGTFTGNDSVNVFSVMKRVTHKLASTSGNGSKRWQVKWKAPATPSKVRFNVACLAANGNGNNSGDSVLVDSLTVFQDMLFSVAELERQLSLYPLPAQDELHTGIQEKFDYSIFELNGRLVAEGTAVEVIPVGELRAGIHLLRIDLDGRQIQRKFLKRKLQ